MSDHAPVDSFTDKVTSEHNQRPKFMAWLAALVQTHADEIAALLAMAAKFDLDQATGQQLDMTGEWIGLSRFIETPLEGVYFTFDDDGTLGWDRGVWWTQYDPLEGLTRLPDGLYRLCLYAKVGRNHWDGTIPSAQQVYDALFAGTGSQIVMQDNEDMTMIFAVVGRTPETVMLAILTSGLLEFRPSAVKATYMVPTIENNPYFGFDVENDSISGFDVGSWGKVVEP